MKCKICKGNLNTLLDLGMQPLANKYPKDDNEKANEQKWQMDVLICSECRCASIANVIDRELMFNDYYYLSSVNPELVSHFEELAEKLRRSAFVLDIGSNDGVLLRPLSKNNVKCLGVDPSINVGKIANDEGLETIIGFFNKETARRIYDEHGCPEHIVASSMFTHLEHPDQFVEDVRTLCNEKTQVIIEIEYLAELIANIQFERFYFDRPFYYSIQAMKVLFDNRGFKLNDVEKITPHGGSLRLTFSLNNSEHPINKRVEQALLNEEKKLGAKAIQLFKDEMESQSNLLKEFLERCVSEQLSVCAYGAPARLATITNYIGITDKLLDCVFEDSPLKIGRYTPGMHIPILSSENINQYKIDVLVVFAYEYINSIYKKTSVLGVPHYAPIPLKKIRDC